ncbi:MAG: cysteine--tRNA ligase, partial [Spirochaetaceae bacterium]|nr:cysteine--tRNA ligase [Spirochaetaceae bacterium]
ALDYRYFLMGGHYRSQLVFSKESLDGARSARKSLLGRVSSFKREIADLTLPALNDLGKAALSRLEAFDEALGDDLNTPRALAEMWQLVKDEKISAAERLSAVLDMDGVLGLNLESAGDETTGAGEDDDLKALMARRQEAREAKDWAAADEIRDELASLGWKIVDTANGPRLEKA